MSFDRSVSNYLKSHHEYFMDLCTHAVYSCFQMNGWSDSTSVLWKFVPNWMCFRLIYLRTLHTYYLVPAMK